MYEPYTRQALPPRKYRELLGSALCVFNSNNAFIIENILNSAGGETYSWYGLIDKESGHLKKTIEATITKSSNNEIATLFDAIVAKRNRIVHSYQITDDDGEQILATKDRSHNPICNNRGIPA